MRERGAQKSAAEMPRIVAKDPAEPFGRTPHVDHVLIAVADLDQGGERLEREHGLVALGGGRHPGLGTANRIVPLGEQYLELIAVVDETEAAGSRLGRRVKKAVEEGRTFVDWALRTDDLEGLRARLRDAGWQLPSGWEGSRKRPDGAVLRWRTQDLETTIGPTPIPFVIEWDVPEGMHPGRLPAAHPSGATRLHKVGLGARDVGTVGEKLRLLLGDSPLYTLADAPSDGIVEVVLDGARGPVVLR
jgi:hypothetical protein